MRGRGVSLGLSVARRLLIFLEDLNIIHWNSCTVSMDLGDMTFIAQFPPVIARRRTAVSMRRRLLGVLPWRLAIRKAELVLIGGTARGPLACEWLCFPWGACSLTARKQTACSCTG